MHAVLHDWTDVDAARILAKLAPAMTRGRSRLLIYEVVLPPTGATPLQAGLDVTLMSLFSSGERSEAAWRGLLGGAGFRVVRIWRDVFAMESVIEAELA
jgi:fumagillin biosynthesis methyltransferase